MNKNYTIRVCKATNPELYTHRARCVQKYTVDARETTNDEPGEFAFEHPNEINEITYAFTDYFEMRQTDYLFHIESSDDILKYPDEQSEMTWENLF